MRLDSAILQHRGLPLIAGFYALQAIALMLAAGFAGGVLSMAWWLVWGAVFLVVGIGILRRRKSAWHLACFLSFAGALWQLLAVACAPGELADGETNIFLVTVNMSMLAVYLVIFAYLRRADIRVLYGVPPSYRSAKGEAETTTDKQNVS